MPAAGNKVLANRSHSSKLIVMSLSLTVKKDKFGILALVQWPIVEFALEEQTLDATELDLSIHRRI